MRHQLVVRTSLQTNRGSFIRKQNPLLGPTSAHRLQGSVTSNSSYLEWWHLMVKHYQHFASRVAQSSVLWSGFEASACTLQRPSRQAFVDFGRVVPMGNAAPAQRVDSYLQVRAAARIRTSTIRPCFIATMTLAFRTVVSLHTAHVDRE